MQTHTSNVLEQELRDNLIIAAKWPYKTEPFGEAAAKAKTAADALLAHDQARTAFIQNYTTIRSSLADARLREQLNSSWLDTEKKNGIFNLFITQKAIAETLGGEEDQRMPYFQPPNIRRSLTAMILLKSGKLSADAAAEIKGELKAARFFQTFEPFDFAHDPAATAHGANVTIPHI